MDLNVTKGAIAHFDEPKVTEVDYEQTHHSHSTTYDGISSGELTSAMISKCVGGVSGTPYYYNEDGMTYYGYCYVTNHGTTTIEDTIGLYDGTVITETRTYKSQFSARPTETTYLNQPVRVVSLVNSYYEYPTVSSMRPTADRTMYESINNVGTLHLVFAVETLRYTYDSEGHVIGYYYEQSNVDYTNNANAYGNYWIANRKPIGNTTETELDMTETVVDNA